MMSQTKQQDGDFYAAATLEQAFSTMLNTVKTEFGARGGADVQMFFQCNDPGARNQHSIWYKGLKDNIVKDCFRRDMEAGKSLDNSAIPMYTQIHLKDMCQVPKDLDNIVSKNDLGHGS